MRDDNADAATGLQFSPVDRDTIIAALRRAASLWTDRDRWRQLQANGMRTDVSWDRPARQYAHLYADLLKMTSVLVSNS